MGIIICPTFCKKFPDPQYSNFLKILMQIRWAPIYDVTLQLNKEICEKFVLGIDFHIR